MSLELRQSGDGLAAEEAPLEHGVPTHRKLEVAEVTTEWGGARQLWEGGGSQAAVTLPSPTQPTHIPPPSPFPGKTCNFLSSITVRPAKLTAVTFLRSHGFSVELAGRGLRHVPRVRRGGAVRWGGGGVNSSRETSRDAVATVARMAFQGVKYVT